MDNCGERVQNEKKEKKFVEYVTEKRGWRWALNSFAVEAWGETEQP